MGFRISFFPFKAVEPYQVKSERNLLKRRDWALENLLSLIVIPNRDVCKDDKPGPGTSSPPGLRGQSQLQLSPSRLSDAAWKLSMYSGEVHLRQEVLTSSRVADAAAFPSCSLLQWSFSRKRLQVGRGDLSAASGKSRVAAWHTLICKVVCMCEKLCQVMNNLVPGKKKKSCSESFF